MTYRTHIVTADLAGACKEQRYLFKEKFGGKAKITRKNMARAIAFGLNVFWLERLIPAEARAECERVKAQALVSALTGGNADIAKATGADQ
jgi:hypothetical protein